MTKTQILVFLTILLWGVSPIITRVAFQEVMKYAEGWLLFEGQPGHFLGV